MQLPNNGFKMNPLYDQAGFAGTLLLTGMSNQEAADYLGLGNNGATTIRQFMKGRMNVPLGVVAAIEGLWKDIQDAAEGVDVELPFDSCVKEVKKIILHKRIYNMGVKNVES